MSEVTVTKLSSKGQIVIPKNLRNALDLKPGALFAMFGEGDTIVLKRIGLPSKEELKQLLDWGSEYAKQRNLTKGDVREAIREIRGKGS